MASAGRRQASGGAAREGETAAGRKGGGGGVITAPAATADVIDLSASTSTWDEEPFLDALQAAESQNAAAAARQSTKTRSGGGGNNRKSIKAEAANGGHQVAAGPLTSISALFGGGGGGNRANRAGSMAPGSSKLRAGKKRPRAATAATGQSSRMKPPLPPTTAAPSVMAEERGGGQAASGEMTGHIARIRTGTAAGSSSGGSISNSDAGTRRAGAGAGDCARGEGGRVEDQLWPDKHRPRDVSGLAVHSKKVDEVRHWMTLALGARPNSEGACRLLALVGPPGSAKSTMVRLLADEMGVELVEWQDTSGQGGPAYRPFADGPALGGERPRHELGSSYQSAVDSFEEFLKRSSYRVLSVLPVKPTRPTGGGISSGGKKKRVVLIEELPEVYGEEKKARLRSLMTECARSSPCPVIICWSQASESNSYQSRLEQVLSRETMRMPGVQITTCNPINATLLRQHLKGVLALEGISDPKGALVAGAIATCAGDIRHALLGLQMSVGGSGGGGGGGVSSRYGAFGLQSNGAAEGLTRRANGAKKKNRRDDDAAATTGSKAAAGVDAGTGMRDTYLSQFHALGKLLYAKRSPPSEAGAKPAGAIPCCSSFGAASLGSSASPSVVRTGSGGGLGQLDFVPEEVLSRGSMELDWALAFLQYHCVDFFTDEDDLARGLGYFSDADVFASRMFDSSKGYDGGGEQGVFPQRYAESIASRATAAANKHPAKSRMRTFGAPKSFEVRRARVEAAGELRRFVGDAWAASGGDVDALWASSRHLKEAVDTELLPAARLITGEWEAEPALRSLLHRFMQSRGEQEGGVAAAAASFDPPPWAAEGAADSRSAAAVGGAGGGGGGGRGGRGEERGEEEEDDIRDF